MNKGKLLWTDSDADGITYLWLQDPQRFRSDGKLLTVSSLLYTYAYALLDTNEEETLQDLYLCGCSESSEEKQGKMHVIICFLSRHNCTLLNRTRRLCYSSKSLLQLND